MIMICIYETLGNYFVNLASSFIYDAFSANEDYEHI